MTPSRRFPVLLLLFVIAPAIEVFRLASLSDLAGRDIWCHLRTGLWIFETHAFPHNGIFSQVAGASWGATTWAYDLTVAVSYRLLGLRAVPLALMISKILLAVLTFLLAGGVNLLPSEHESPRDNTNAFWGAVFLSVIAQYVLGAVAAGPEYCSVLLFAIELLLLLEFRSTANRHLLFALPPVFLLWANVDTQFVYGIGMLLLFLIASVLQPSTSQSRSAAEIKFLAIITAASFAATFVTPYWYRSWAVFFETLTSPANHYFGDFSAMTFHRPQDYALLLLTMSAFLALGRRRSRDGFLIGLLAGCAALSFHSQRDTWLVTIASLAVINSNRLVSDNTRAKVAAERAPTGRWQSCLVPAGVALIVAAVACFAIPSPRMQAKLAEVYPVAAADAIRSRQLPLPMFNSYEFGGFLIWSLPDYPVAIDGRTDLYGSDFMTQYAKAMNADIPYTAFPAMADARTLVISRKSIMADALAGLPGFKSVYRDDVTVVMERQDEPQPSAP